MLTAVGSQRDTAPDTGVWTYRISPPHVQRATLRYTPTVPRAGRRFVITGITLVLTTGERVQPASFSCRATLAGRALRGSGRGRCTLPIPRNARGKRLAVVVTPTLGPDPVQLRPYVFRVG